MRTFSTGVKYSIFCSKKNLVLCARDPDISNYIARSWSYATHRPCHSTNFLSIDVRILHIYKTSSSAHRHCESASVDNKLWSIHTAYFHTSALESVQYSMERYQMSDLHSPMLLHHPWHHLPASLCSFFYCSILCRGGIHRDMYDIRNCVWIRRRWCRPVE